MTNNDASALNIIDNRPNLELLNVLKYQIKRSEEVVGMSRGWRRMGRCKSGLIGKEA